MLDNYQSQHRRVDILPTPSPTSPPPNNRGRVQITTNKSDSPDLESLRAAVLRSKVILTRVPEIKDRTLEEGQELVHARIVDRPLDKKEEKDASSKKENDTRSSKTEGEEALRQAVLLTLRKKSAAKSISTPLTTEVEIKNPTLPAAPTTLSSVPPLTSFHQQIIIPLSNPTSGGSSDDPSSLASRRIPSPLESPNNPLNHQVIHSPSGKTTIQDTIAMMKRQIAEKEKQRDGDNIPLLKDVVLRSSPSDSGDEIILSPLELRPATTNHSTIGLKKIQELEDRKKELQAGVEKIEMEIASRLMTPTALS